ncbi:hypothetical protein TRFO_03236 [Tritrichomonas foetus]|uniref:Transmembrane amino acid transporter protein n=1 Tax=Tritrichomonas foetus TaxID=1144522 RepID=A0A1J4KTF2_9EUKA|nr:hypothetical protein TRFO_03236 [Tritrichomonas foetus]|eukprot:OHT14168.1 hypothetical protein TRFO_03236 [Tritrichomonas foetus]
MTIIDFSIEVYLIFFDNLIVAVDMDEKPKHEEQMTNISFFTFHKRKDSLIYRKDSRNQTFDMFSATVILLGCAYGTDPFFFGGGFDCGFGLMIFLVTFVFALVIFSYFLMMKCWIYGVTFSYRTLWETTISKRLSFLPDLFIFLNYLSWVLYYYDEAYWMFIEIMNYFFPGRPKWVDSKFFVNYAITALTSLNIIFQKELSGFFYMSIIKIVSITVATEINVLKLVTRLNDQTFSINANIINRPNNFAKICAFIAYAVGVFGNNALIEHIVQFVSKPTYKRITISYIIAEILSFTYIMSNSFCSIFMFSHSSFYENFLFYYDPNEPGAIVTKICCYIFLLTTIYPFQWLASRHLTQIFSSSWELSNWQEIWFIPQCFACLVTILMSTAWTYMSTYVGLFANFFMMAGYIMLYYILPPIFFLRLFKQETRKMPWTISSLFLLIVGIFLFSYTLVNNFIELVRWARPIGYD